MSRPKILVVEDERIVALDIASLLESLGYAVVGIVSWAEEAIRQAEEAKPDLVLMDIHLKGEMDGIEAAQRIRTDLDVPVVYLTAYADRDTLERAKVTESYGYLLKPFEGSELHTAIEMALHKHKMEQRLKESEQRLAATLKSIGEAVIATDAQGQIQFMNPVAQMLTGWAEKDALGRELGQVLHLIDGGSQAPIPDLAARVLAGRQMVQLPPNVSLVARDGREMPVAHSAAPIQDERGALRGVVLTLRDITEQVQAHEALRRYAAELQARNEELDAFAHTVAHDIKDPLSTLIGYTTLLRQENARYSDEQRQHFLENVTDYALRMCNIVDELLLLAATRGSEVEKQPLNMADIVNRAQRRLGQLQKEHGGEIIQPDVWPVALGYAPWVEEVWVNYLSNGIKYGGRPPRLELGGTAQPDGMVRFWVRDNGHGISPEDQARLFTPFTRLSQVKVRGHGLGLSIVQRIVERLGGEASVESFVGVGSTFAFTLPGARVRRDCEAEEGEAYG